MLLLRRTRYSYSRVNFQSSSRRHRKHFLESLRVVWVISNNGIFETKKCRCRLPDSILAMLSCNLLAWTSAKFTLSYRSINLFPYKTTPVQPRHSTLGHITPEFSPSICYSCALGGFNLFRQTRIQAISRNSVIMMTLPAKHKVVSTRLHRLPVQNRRMSYVCMITTSLQ